MNFYISKRDLKNAKRAVRRVEKRIRKEQQILYKFCGGVSPLMLGEKDTRTATEIRMGIRRKAGIG